MDETIIYLAAFVTLVAVAVATAIIAVKRNGRGTDELIKQLIIWAAIAALMPATSYAGATLIHPRTELTSLYEQRSRLQSETYDTKDEAKRAARRDEAEKINKRIKEETAAFYGARFWVGFPIGLGALIVGLYLPSVAVGTGMAFGGLCTLTAGCYSYWDDMGDKLRFVSLLLVLVILTGIGLSKFGKPNSTAATADST